jgi:hypothetical protein
MLYVCVVLKLVEMNLNFVVGTLSVHKIQQLLAHPVVVLWLRLTDYTSSVLHFPKELQWVLLNNDWLSP